MTIKMRKVKTPISNQLPPIPAIFRKSYPIFSLVNILESQAIKSLNDVQTIMSSEDEQYMRRALELAKQAVELQEVPVGAVLVHDGKVIGEGYNQPIKQHDPTAHAEVVALRQATSKLNNYRLPKGSTLYVTLEPCAMCVGALLQARVERLVFAAKDLRAGAVVSVFQLLDDFRLNHRVQYTAGLLADECGDVLRAFFKARRN